MAKKSQARREIEEFARRFCGGAKAWLDLAENLPLETVRELAPEGADLSGPIAWTALTRWRAEAAVANKLAVRRLRVTVHRSILDLEAEIEATAAGLGLAKGIARYMIQRHYSPED